MKRCLLIFFFTICYTCLQAQITCDGNINEGYWGMPLATATGGPTPCAGNNVRLNSLYAAANDSNILVGIGGITQNSHHILLFIDSKIGGSSQASFSRTGAPACLQNMPAGTTFDAGFTPDYCLIISNNATTSTTVRLYTLSATAGSLTAIADINGASTTAATGCAAGAMPSATDFTKGYEVSITRLLLGYVPANQAVVKFMAMLIADDGSLTNQFLTRANAADANCFGKGVNNAGVQFQTEAAINPVDFNPSRSLPITFLDVKAFQVRQVIGIFWTSASESNMLEYQIERSADALQYTSIGVVAARGNSTSQTNYEYPDAQPLPGKSFYRVKAIDRSGRSTYSAVLKMQYGHVDNSLIIYPNPVKDQINLQIVGLRPDTYHLQVFNDLGQCLIEKDIVYTGGYGLQQIPLLPNMRKGPYRLLLRNKAYFYKQHFIVQ